RLRADGARERPGRLTGLCRAERAGQARREPAATLEETRRLSRRNLPALDQLRDEGREAGGGEASPGDVEGAAYVWRAGLPFKPEAHPLGALDGLQVLGS